MFQCQMKLLKHQMSTVLKTMQFLKQLLLLFVIKSERSQRCAGHYRVALIIIINVFKLSQVVHGHVIKMIYLLMGH